MKKGHSELNPPRDRAFGQICFRTTRDIPDIRAQLTDFRATLLLRGVGEKPEIEALLKTFNYSIVILTADVKYFLIQTLGAMDSFGESQPPAVL